MIRFFRSTIWSTDDGFLLSNTSLLRISHSSIFTFDSSHNVKLTTFSSTNDRSMMRPEVVWRCERPHVGGFGSVNASFAAAFSAIAGLVFSRDDRESL